MSSVFKFIFGKQSEISTSPLSPGHIIMTDAGRLYLDRPDGIGRMELTDVKVIQTELDRLAIMTPVDGFYYVIQVNKLYRCGFGEWVCLNPEPDFIGADGKILSGYLAGYGDASGWPGESGKPGASGIPGQPGDVVLLGPNGVIPEGYCATSSATTKGIASLGALGGAARYGVAEDVGLGKVLNATQVKRSDVETNAPTASSPDTSVTSASQLYQLLGGTIDELETDDQTIIGAINELYAMIQEK